MSATGLPAPGSFAALLKQSKFATYHPSISRVYTVFGGHAQRGDWGLKRALPERKRHRRLKISAIDTREQQSWFDSGESDARTVARWDEIGTRVNVAYGQGRWREQGFTKLAARATPNIDSEFGGFAVPKMGHVDPALGLRYDFNSKLFPNIHKMSEPGFDKYLEKIQGRRSEFCAHVQRVEDDRSTVKGRPVSLYYYRNKSHEGFGRTGNDFLELLAEDEITKGGSKILQAVPHPNGGLSYTSPSYLQTRLTATPIKSHVIFTPRFATGMAVVGSITAKVAANWKNNKQVLCVDYRREDPQRGTYNMRVIDAYMQDPPQVVGRRISGGVDTMKMEVSVHPVDSDAMDHERANPYPPGSVLYCFSESGRAISVPRVIMKHPRVHMSKSAKQKLAVQGHGALDSLLGKYLINKP
jgi:hypothetical protein